MDVTTVADLHMGDLFTLVPGGKVLRVRNVDSWGGETWIGIVGEPSARLPSDTRVYMIDR